MKTGRRGGWALVAMVAMTWPLAVRPAWAQPAADPTRPPGTVLAPSAPGTIPAEATDAGAQATIVRKGAGKSGALLNGQYVEVGSRVGEQRVVRVTESEIVLAGPKGRERIRLTPGVEKTRRKTVEAAR